MPSLATSLARHHVKLTTESTPSWWTVLYDRLKTPKGLEEACKVVSYSKGWAENVGPSFGYTPSATFAAAGKAAGQTKNAISAMSFPTSFADAASKGRLFLSTAWNEGITAEKTGKAFKDFAQSALGLTSPIYDASEFWEQRISPLSQATQELIGKINFPALGTMMAWKANDEVNNMSSHALNQSIAKSDAKKEEYGMRYTLAAVNLVNRLSYVALAVLKIAHLFFAVAVPGWGYLACVTMGLITGVGGHFYERMNGLDKKPSILGILVRA